MLKEETRVQADRNPFKLKTLAAGMGFVAHRLLEVGAASAAANAKRSMDEYQGTEDYIEFQLKPQLGKQAQMHRDRLMMAANATARMVCDSWRAGSLDTYEQLLEHQAIMGHLGDRTLASIYLRPEDRDFLESRVPDLAGEQASTLMIEET